LKTQKNETEKLNLQF